MVIRVYWGHKLSNHTKLSYTMMSLLFAASGLFSRTIITNWIKLSSIIGNYCPRKMRLAASYKLFLFTYLTTNLQLGVANFP